MPRHAAGYSPNVMARGLASRQSGIIAVLLNDLHNPFFAEIFDGLRLRADTDGYQLLLGAGGAKRFTEQAALDSFFQFRRTASFSSARGFRPRPS